MSFKGVLDVRGRGQQVAHLGEAAELAVLAAEQASAAGTYGVGGALVGPGGKLLALCQNCVIQNGRVCDPTAHAERQIIDWYYAQPAGSLPPATQLTIVSSLDPCMMCAGAILHCGMRVTTVAFDEIAGVNWDRKCLFASLPSTLRPRAGEQFGYLGVEGERAPQGWTRETIPSALLARSRQAFWSTLESVQSQVHSPIPPGGRRSECNELRRGASEVPSGGRRGECDELRRGVAGVGGEQPHAARPLPDTREFLERLAGATGDAACLVDPQGRIVLSVPSQEHLSPIRTAFMELTRAHRLLDLSPFTECRVVSLLGPGSDALGVMQLGAYGSSTEGPLPVGSRGHWQYHHPVVNDDEMSALVAAFPPLYSQVIRPDIARV